MTTLIYDTIKIKNKVLLLKGSLEIQDVGVNLINGANGTGKTLLINNIFFHCQETSIEAVLVDQDNNCVLENRTIFENIALDNNKDGNNEIPEILHQFGLNDLLNRIPSKLSGGEKKIICIMRAVLTNASFIIMDEPTNDLDPNMVKKLIEIIDYFSSAKCFLIVTHDDRLESLSNNIFRLNNQTILKESSTISKCIPKVSRQFAKKDNSQFIKGLFNKYIVGYISSLILIFVSIIVTSNLMSISDTAIKKTTSNQVDIYIPLSDIGDLYTLQGACSISSLTLMHEGYSIFDAWENVTKSLNGERKPINYGLDLLSTDNYLEYTMEYYDIDLRQHFYTLDKYLELIINEKLDSSTEELSSVFAYEKSKMGPEGTKFSQEIFNESERYFESMTAASGSKLEPLHSIIILDDDYSFWQFVKDSSFQNLTNGNFFVRSNETIDIVNSGKAIAAYVRDASLICMICFVILLAEMIYTYTYMHFAMRRIRIIKNSGHSKHLLLTIMHNKWNDKYIRLLLVVVLLLINIGILNGFADPQSLENYFAPITISIFEVSIFFINKKIVTRRINKVYDWRYR